jgi:hypothetical protein
MKNIKNPKTHWKKIRIAHQYNSAVLHSKPPKIYKYIKYDLDDDESSITSNRSSCPSLKLRTLINVELQCRRCIEQNVSPPALFCCPVSRLPAEKGRMLGGASAKTRFKYLLSKHENRGSVWKNKLQNTDSVICIEFEANLYSCCTAHSHR